MQILFKLGRAAPENASGALADGAEPRGWNWSRLIPQLSSASRTLVRAVMPRGNCGATSTKGFNSRTDIPTFGYGRIDIWIPI